MALLAYSKVVGQTQNWIQGGTLQKGAKRENMIGVIAVSHSVVSPRDPQSGLPTGQRLHKPLVLTQELDKSVPLLYNSLCTNENIKDLFVYFWTPQVKAVSGAGQEVQHFTIHCENANIASMDFRMANIKHPDLQRFAEYLEIAFTYEKITWTWEPDGKTATDHWLERK